jgi:hypothetical protein
VVSFSVHCSTEYTKVLRLVWYSTCGMEYKILILDNNAKNAERVQFCTKCAVLNPFAQFLKRK